MWVVCVLRINQPTYHTTLVPNVRRIVYSTCSVHEEENECVVMNSLIQHPDFRLASRDSCLPEWPTRGHSEPFGGDVGLAQSVIRCSPGTDRTNGFFVACFERVDTAEGARVAAAAPAKKRKNKNKNNKKKSKTKSQNQSSDV